MKYKAKSSIEKSKFEERDEGSIHLPELNSLSVCSCCLELAWKQGMWEPCTWMDQEEIYGEMLQECFGIVLLKEENKRYLICEVCITQLRSALNFKRQVLTCRQLLLNNVIEFQELPHVTDKSTMSEWEIVDTDINNEKHIYYDQSSSYSDTIGSPDDECPSNTEDDINDQEPIKKGPKKKKVGASSNENKHDKENTKNDVKKSKEINKVKEIKKLCSSNNKIQQENHESKMYNGQTKAKKKGYRHLTRSRKQIQEITNKASSKRFVNYLKPRLNLCVLLENSTLVPFKANKGCFFCFYCAEQFAVFDELKQHTRARHNDVKFKDILKRFYRPERVRADASDIHCKICQQKLDNVGTLVEHLTKRHDLQFSDHARKPVECIIPYDLSDGKNRCCICGKEFVFFKMLSKHMNEHTTNYICNVCGKCFLLPERLQTHKHSHITGPAVKCEQCGKKMQNEFLLRTHIRNVHNKSMYGCIVCDLKFRTFRERLAHLDKSHGVNVTNVECPQCHKTFMSPQNMYKHMKYIHLMIRCQGNYECDLCSRAFRRKTELAQHMLVHTKERNFECHVCQKRYPRRSTLNAHLRIHADDRRWACRECGADFVQKCSLHYHIKTHHKGAELDSLVVCRQRH